MYRNFFDFNNDGKLDAAEQALEFMTFCAVTGEEDSDNDEFDFEEDNDEGEDDF